MLRVFTNTPTLECGHASTPCIVGSGPHPSGAPSPAAATLNPEPTYFLLFHGTIVRDTLVKGDRGARVWSSRADFKDAGVGHHPTAPGLKAPVVLCDGRLTVMLTIPKVRTACIGKHCGHWVVPLGLVLREGQHLVRLLGQTQYLCPPLPLDLTAGGSFHSMGGSAYHRTHRHNYEILPSM